MKPLSIVIISLAGALSLAAAPMTLTNTSLSVTYADPGPTIDALTWSNSAPMYKIYSTNDYYPFTATSMANFLNSGQMFGKPGYRFEDYEVYTSPHEKSLAGWVNSGSIYVASRLTVLSANIVNSGRLVCNDQGWILLNASNNPARADLQNAGLQAGLMAGIDPVLETLHSGRNALYGTGTNLSAVYTNDVNVTDIYWGGGMNNRIGGTNIQADPVDLPGLASLLSVPMSPFHDSANLATFLPRTNNFTQVPLCGANAFRAYVHTNSPNPSNHVVQVVYVATNAATAWTNLQVDVRFVVSNSFTKGYTSIVQFAYSDTNIVDGRPVASYLYLLDSALMSGVLTGTDAIYENMKGDVFSRRPANYELTRVMPAEWSSVLPLTNSVAALYVSNSLAPAFFYPPLFPVANPDGSLYGSVTNLGYVGYSTYAAWLGITNFAPRLNPLISDATNFLGKVEVFASTLNATNARIRAESYAGVQTTNLQNNRLPKFDAPFISADIGFGANKLIISNSLPAHVVRFFGQLSVYSVVYSNAVALATPNPTNGTLFSTNHDMTVYHVTIVDSCMQPPGVLLHKFVMHGSQLEIDDPLTINNSMILDVTNLTIGAQGGLYLPLNASWAPSNAPSLKNLTNWGTISIPRDATFTLSNSAPYNNFVNHGFIGGSSIHIQTGYVENSTNDYYNRARIVCTNGNFQVDAATGWLTNGFLTNGSGPITLNITNLSISRTTIGAGSDNNASTGLPMPGALVISAPFSLGDGSWWDTNTLGWHLASNEWRVTGGFQVNHLPTSNSKDLWGTTIYSIIVPAGPNTHVWPGRDLGTNSAGFSNNLVLGKLVLDSQGYNTIRFQGPDPTNKYAIYVDCLELLNDATNIVIQSEYQQVFDIATNFTIYFANASMPQLPVFEQAGQLCTKLDGAADGRLAWVHEFSGNYNFAGPYSQTNIHWTNYNVVPFLDTTNVFNIGLVRYLWSLGIDYPNFLGQDIGLSVRKVFTSIVSGQAPDWYTQLSWNGMPFSTYTVWYSTNFSFSNPQPLGGTLEGSDQMMYFIDPTPTSRTPQRYYRVKEALKWPLF